jgi:hypothetical protein
MFDFNQNLYLEISELQDDGKAPSKLSYKNRIVANVAQAFELICNRYGDGDSYDVPLTCNVMMDDMHGAAPLVVIPYKAMVRFFWRKPIYVLRGIPQTA